MIYSALLKEFLTHLAKAFISITKGVIRFIIYIFSKWVLFGVVGLIGVLVSFGVSKIFGDTYQSELVIRTNAIPVNEVKVYIDMLSSQFTDKAYDKLAQELNLPEQDVRSIKSLDVLLGY